MNDELQQLKDQLATSKSLQAIKRYPEWADLRKLWMDTIEELKNIDNIGEDVETEVKARKIATDFLMGIIDSVDNADEDTQELQKDIENKGRSDRYT